MNELALFAGAGGGILGGKLLGWRTVCAVEVDAYASAVLLARQNDGCLAPFPVWDDVRTFDGVPWRGIVDVVSGGFPCQDISLAGRGAGITGARSGLWKQFARIIREVGPRFVFVENSPALRQRGLNVVLGDLAEMGYDAEWCVLGADDAGAPHIRKRIWILAHANSGRGRAEIAGRNNTPGENAGRTQADGLPGACCDSGDERSVANANGIARHEGWTCHTAQEPRGRNADRSGVCSADVGNADSTGLEIGQSEPSNNGAQHPSSLRANWWAIEPDVGRVANELADKLDEFRPDKSR